MVVRCRPLNGKEKEDGRVRIIDMDTNSGLVTLKNPKSEAGEQPKTFTFDQVFDWNVTQKQVRVIFSFCLLNFSRAATCDESPIFHMVRCENT